MTLDKKSRDKLIKYRIERSILTVKQVERALQDQDFNLAVNRIYYACFYLLSALALKHEFATSKHKQLIGWFNKKI